MSPFLLDHMSSYSISLRGDVSWTLEKLLLEFSVES
jgi:hypothetical protein